MIVERWTFATKGGDCWERMLELLKAERERTGDFEIYTCTFGPKQAFFATETRYESLAELEKHWREYASTPEGTKFIKAFRTLASDALPSTREVWNVE